MTKKYKLSDLVAQNRRMEPLIHPEYGDVGGWIEIRPPQSQEIFAKQLALQVLLARLDKDSDDYLTKLYEANADYASEAIVAWDEEFFDKPYSKHEGYTLFTNAQYIWIRDAVLQELNKAEAFFKKG